MTVWQTNHDMVRGLTRFSWVARWFAFGCGGVAVAAGIALILLTD